jgi:hypothetical protein
MRVAVALDCILDRGIKITKVLGIPVSKEEVTYNRRALSYFWKFGQDHGYTLELVGFGYSQEEMDDILDDLDNLGTNPFNYAKAYFVPADLVAELPYRPELKHVIDIPERSMRYGHWYLGQEAINGSR